MTCAKPGRRRRAEPPWKRDCGRRAARGPAAADRASAGARSRKHGGRRRRGRRTSGRHRAQARGAVGAGAHVWRVSAASRLPALPDARTWPLLSAPALTPSRTATHPAPARPPARPRATRAPTASSQAQTVTPPPPPPPPPQSRAAMPPRLCGRSKSPVQLGPHACLSACQSVRAQLVVGVRRLTHHVRYERSHAHARTRPRAHTHTHTQTRTQCRWHRCCSSSSSCVD